MMRHISAVVEDACEICHIGKWTIGIYKREAGEKEKSLQRLCLDCFDAETWKARSASLRYPLWRRIGNVLSAARIAWVHRHHPDIDWIVDKKQADAASILALRFYALQAIGKRGGR